MLRYLGHGNRLSLIDTPTYRVRRSRRPRQSLTESRLASLTVPGCESHHSNKISKETSIERSRNTSGQQDLLSVNCPPTPMNSTGCCLRGYECVHLKVMPVASQRSTVQNPRTLFLRETGTGSPSFIVTEARGWRCRPIP